jgi:opacity protein-like surface antigen
MPDVAVAAAAAAAACAAAAYAAAAAAAPAACAEPGTGAPGMAGRTTHGFWLGKSSGLLLALMEAGMRCWCKETAGGCRDGGGSSSA